MFHYFNSIQNTQGDALVGYFIKAVSSTSGSVVDIYADSSGTAIEAVSGVANAAEVDSDGNASFYIPGGTYHLDIYATDGTTSIRRISDVQMVDFATLSTTGIGYAVGAGGTVTQLTSKSTAVTLNTICGQITTHSGSIASSAFAGFQVHNSAVAATDVVVLTPLTGNATAGTYNCWVEGITTGTFIVIIKNVSGGALAETLTLNFAVIKAVTA